MILKFVQHSVRACASRHKCENRRMKLRYDAALMSRSRPCTCAGLPKAVALAVTGDHATAADQGVVADGNAGQDDRSGPDPDVAADADLTAELRPDARPAASRGWSATRICTPGPI